MAVRLDVTRQEQIDEAVRLIEAKEADFKFLFDVNVFGVFRVTQAFAPMEFMRAASMRLRR